MITITIILSLYFLIKKHGNKILKVLRNKIDETFGFVLFAQEMEIEINTTYSPEKLRNIRNTLEEMYNTNNYLDQQSRLRDLLFLVDIRIKKFNF